MAIFDIGFEWRVDDNGYEIEKRKRKKGDTALTTKGGTFIVRRGGQLRPKKPLVVAPTLFMDFARLDDSTESCVGFASKWGLLGLSSGPDDNPDGESLALWKVQIKTMRADVKIWKDDPDMLFAGGRKEIKVTDVSVLLIPSPPDGLPAMSVRPTTLIGAMRLQLAGAIHKGAVIGTCSQCGEWFGAGGDFKRIDSKFCSDKCRADFHNAAKKRKSS